jgi:uncharacterized protein YutE (UPF0331/DUF86 family)
MTELKKISRDAIPRAVQKAERYRLLNQSWATESICLDILEVDPGNQQVLVMLLLAITDQFGPESHELARRAREVLKQITDPYQKAYYAGIVDERLGHAQLAQGIMHAEAMAYESLKDAMDSFARAEQLRPPGNDDAILRWNTCARTLQRLRLVEPAEGQYEPSFGE